jgi:hypothetical protein
VPAKNEGEKNPFHPKIPKWNRGKNKKTTISGLSAFINTYRNEQKANRAQEDTEDRGKKWREIWTLVFVILTTAGIFYQAYLFRGQLAEMKSSGEQAAQLVENNATLAVSAAKQAEAADKQANAMNEAVKVSRESLVAAGRAWVGPRNAKISGAIEAGKPGELVIEYANTGREPALNFVYSIDAFSSTNAEEKNGVTIAKINATLKGCKAVERLGGGQVIFPSTGFSSYNLTSKTADEVFDQEMIDGEKTLIVQGCFLYNSFNIIRHSYFCYFYRAKTTKPENLNICANGHYAD